MDQSTFWKQKWELGDIKFNRAVPHAQLTQHFARVAPGKVMVPLCGKSVDLLWLQQQGHEVVGVELSAIACEAFFQENALPFQVQTVGEFTVYRGERLTLWCGDFFRLPAEPWGGVTAIYDRAALIALPPSVRRQYAENIVTQWDRSTVSSAEVLLITVEYPAALMQGPPFSVTEAEIAELYGREFRVEKLASELDPSLASRNSQVDASQVRESVYRPKSTYVCRSNVLSTFKIGLENPK